MRTLRSKMLILILLPIIAIVAGVAFITYFQVSKTVTSNVEQMAHEIAAKASDIVDEWLNGLVKEIKTFAERNVVINALKTGEYKDLMEKDLKPKLKDRPEIEMFFIAYPDGSAPTTLGSVAQIADRG
ncbi:MAG: methyl-accepting chemotaxis protein, partial [Pseudothermotoga sp.]